MKRHPIRRFFRLALFFAALLTAVSSCVFEYGEDTAPSGPSYHLTLTVQVGGAVNTRAGHTDDETDSGTEAENFIDFDAGDFRVSMFDKNGNFLLNLGPADNWVLYPTLTNGNGSRQYQMECKIEFPDSMTESDIEAIRTSGVQLLLLANWQAMGGNYEDLFMPRRNTQNLSGVWVDGTNYNFAYAPDNGSKTWRPDHTASPKRLIPMFGYAGDLVFAAVDGVGHRASSTIWMQRAVAKIEVIDNLEEQPQLEVTDVTLTKYNMSGRFIPDVKANPGWNNSNEGQVGLSSLPGNVETGTGLKFFRESASNGRNRWIAYVPEMALPAGEQVAGKWAFPTERPRLQVEVKPKAGSSLSGVYAGETYPVHFAKYDENYEPTLPDDSWNHILRNHIYRFFINKVGLNVQLHLHVLPWDPDDEEVWDFTDHVTVSQELKWKENTYMEGPKSDYGERDLLLKLDNTILEGSFKIATPVHGRWYARLTPIGDAKPNAVSFVDKDGNILEPSDGDPKACMEVSGVIYGPDATEAKLYIRPTRYDNDIESRFKLDFWVENLGVWIAVPMPDGPFTIIRPANLIV